MLDRTIPPVVREIESFKLPIPDKYPLSNGADLFVMREMGIDVLKIDVVFEGGRSTEDVPDVSSFVSGLLKEGTNQYTSSEINRYLESLGAFIECVATMDRVIMSVYTLRENLSPVMDRVGDLLNDSLFSTEEISKYKTSRLSRFKINLEKTSFHARREFLQVLYGAEHPYGRISNISDLEVMSRSHIFDYYNKSIKDQNFTVFASGDIDTLEIETIDNSLGLLNRNVREKDILPAHSYTAQRIERNIEKAVQSTLYVGCHVPGPEHHDTHKIAIVNEILGGYFGSRLMKNLREDKGYTYGMYSRINHLGHASYLSASADVIKDSRGAAMTEVEKELKVLMNERVGEDELQVVKNYLLGTFLSSVNSSFSMMQLFRFLYSHKLPLTYFDQQLLEIKSTSSDDILELARTYFNPEDMSWVTIG